MSARDNLVFDVGLHKGEDTDFNVRKGYTVVAFEADPALAAHCRARFGQEIADGRLTIVEGAIASADALTHTSAVHASGPFGADLPGPWRSRAKALPSCRRVFAGYRLLGQGALLRTLFGARVLRVLSRLIRRPLPGRYDTHARLETE